ncbi:transposase [Arthrobacter sp. UYEF20]|uniref:transposase n=1 Tax=Arthrobacter sp. UYEF20 TaxID=1756363 RepID=UPI003399148E
MKLATNAGDLNLKSPKPRNGSFSPTLLKGRRRVDQALYAVVMEAYLRGVSTRKSRRSGRGPRGRYRDLQVRSFPDLRGPGPRSGAFQDRPGPRLSAMEYPYVFLDAT